MASHRKPSAQTYDPRTVKEHIVETPLNEEMSKSFLEYAYSVIYARALPDARDGLKPVQRRIVYQMGEMNLTPDRPYMKSARVVGEVMGKLHPHGDSAIYEAMVRLAQPFAMRLPLVDGHGNFGSLDDGPAASRYTEARLGPAALGMNADIDEDTVDFTPNYDNKLKEPTVLPAAIPNLLVNGGSGIAVGMATNLATHNLGEVVNAAKFLMAHSDATLEQLMRYVPGPDWPTGGTIIGRDGIREAYATGRGTLTTRAATHIEHVTARKQAIVVTELPYMVGPSGSGKTTLMNLLGCLDVPTSGEYLLAGEDVTQANENHLAEIRNRLLGFVFQSFYLLPKLSAVDNVALPLLYAGVNKKERRERAIEALQMMGLGQRLNFRPNQLSGGQCQRVAIARAIVGRPKLLLADEPTGALDSAAGNQIMDIFDALNDTGSTIIMITHEQEIAERAKRINYIRDGILSDGRRDGESLA